MSKRIIIVGAFIEIVELAEELGTEIQGYFDNIKTGEYLGYPILGTDEQALGMREQFKSSFLILSPDLPLVREKLFNFYSQSKFSYSKLISRFAIISKSAIIGEGTIIQSLVNVSSECRIGKFVKLNTGCNVMHNSVIEDFSTVAPNAVVLGNINVGKRCYIGSNATILPNLRIIDDVTIAAGSVVTKDIFEPGVYLGSPARKRM